MAGIYQIYPELLKDINDTVEKLNDQFKKNYIPILELIASNREHMPKVIYDACISKERVMELSVDTIVKEGGINAVKLLIHGMYSCECNICKPVQDSYEFKHSIPDQIVLNGAEIYDKDILNIGYSMGGVWCADDYHEDINDEEQIACIEWIGQHLTEENKQKQYQELQAYFNSRFNKLFNCATLINHKITVQRID